METDILKTISIGEIVARDFRTASVFKNNRIDFCCGGKKSLEETCLEKRIDQEKVEAELQAVAATPPNPGQDFQSWSPGFLCDYIMNTHHRYVLKTLPDLLLYPQNINCSWITPSGTVRSSCAFRKNQCRITSAFKKRGGCFIPGN